MKTPPLKAGDTKLVCFECGCPKGCEKARLFKMVKVTRIGGKLDMEIESARLVEE